MAPSIYEYRNPREWETAMAEWCAENEPKAAKITYYAYMTDLPWGNPLRRVRAGQTFNHFDTPEEMHAWIKEMEAKGFELLSTSESVDNLADLIRPAAEKVRDGGSRDDYQMAGLKF